MATPEDMDRAISMVYYGDEHPEPEPLHTFWASKLKRAVDQGLFTEEAYQQCTMLINILEGQSDGSRFAVGPITMTTREPLQGDFSFYKSLRVRDPCRG